MLHPTVDGQDEQGKRWLQAKVQASLRPDVSPSPTGVFRSMMEDDLVYALHQMSLGEYRPLPVVDDQRRPIALVSRQAIIRYFLAFFPQEGFNFPPSPAHRIASARDGA